MSTALMLRNVRAGQAVVADRLSGWPVADVRRVRPGRWEVTVDGTLVATGPTRSEAVADTLTALQRRRLIRTTERETL